MGDRNLPRELKRWAIEEFNLPPQHLPPGSYFKTLCLGQATAIWKYATQHIYNQRNVRIMRGNLQWYKTLQDDEVRCVRDQSEATRREELQKEMEELRAELRHLDMQMNGAEVQLAAEERSVNRSWECDRDSRRRELLLHAFRRRCVEERGATEQDNSRFSGYCQAFTQLSRMAEVEPVFGGEAVGSCDSNLAPACPEPQVLREVRELVEERVRFFQSLLESELKSGASSAARVFREQRGAVFQHWLSAVEDLLRSHPPSHILSALQHLASRQQGSLQEKLATLDVGQEVAALRYRYESSHLQDLSRKEEDLPSVKSLLQAGWQDVEQLFVQQLQAQTRLQQLRTQLDARRKEAELELPDNEGQTMSVPKSVLDLELQCVMAAALRDSTLQHCEQLEEQARRRQDALHGLRSQWQTIMDFRQLVDNKQEHIRGLIKGNSAAKTDVCHVHTEVAQFVKLTLAPLCQTVMEAAGNLRNAVSQEVRQLAGVSLVALDARVFEGVQRIPAECLSIHRLHSGAFHSLCQNLAFPMYRAPEQLCAQAVSQQLELRFVRWLLQLYESSLAALQKRRALLPAPDLQALLLQVCEVDEELLRSLVPRICVMSQRTSQALLYVAEAKTTIAHWWEQPAQFVLPELTREGLTLQQWLQRWKLVS